MYIFIINYVLEVAMGRYKIIKEVIKNQSNIEKKMKFQNWSSENIEKIILNWMINYLNL